MAYTVSGRHVDTCLPDYVLDHCNGEDERLMGVPVDNATTVRGVIALLLEEFREDYKMPEDLTEAEFRACLHGMFGSADPQAAFDASLPEPPDDEAFNMGETSSAWFRFTWEAQ